LPVAFVIAELTDLPAIVYLETAHEGQALEDPNVGASFQELLTVTAAEG
jgi:hypothetical protein